MKHPYLLWMLYFFTVLKYVCLECINNEKTVSIIACFLRLIMKQKTSIIVVILWSCVSYLDAQYHNFSHNGLTRQYIYYEPPDLADNAPLVFVMHGYSGDAYSIKDYTQMNNIASQNGFAVCYPRGTRDNWGNRFWNVGYEFHEGINVDDVGFISELAAYLQTTHNLNPANTFATGMSNGGDMSFFLACEVPSVFRAVAPVCGTVMQNNFEFCTQAIPVLAINGTEDDITWYSGDPGNESGWGAYPGIPEIIDHFVGLNQCTNLYQETLEDSNPHDGSIVEFDRYYNGPNDNEVWLYRVVGGGHDWPGSSGNMDINASEEVWNFFSQFLIVTHADDEFKQGIAAPVLFPNPSHGHSLNIIFAFQHQTSLCISDISGKVVFKESLEPVVNPVLNFNSKLETGLYSIVFNDGKTFRTYKFTVIK
jgi:polyhydroxybutyrate depolymerase